MGQYVGDYCYGLLCLAWKCILQVCKKHFNPFLHVQDSARKETVFNLAKGLA